MTPLEAISYLTDYQTENKEFYTELGNAIDTLVTDYFVTNYKLAEIKKILEDKANV